MYTTRISSCIFTNDDIIKKDDFLERNKYWLLIASTLVSSLPYSAIWKINKVGLNRRMHSMQYKKQ